MASPADNTKTEVLVFTLFHFQIFFVKDLSLNEVIRRNFDPSLPIKMPLNEIEIVK